MSFISKAFYGIAFFSWDVGTAIVNLIIPPKSKGKVTPEGHPGFGGKWPEYVPPKEGDSRCSCPALNAMANHGILPHDGKNIQFKEMGKLIRTTYNFSSSFCYFVPKFAADMINKNYSKDTFDLNELDLHNGIEHDASFCRQDTALCPDQSEIHPGQIKEFLASATGKDRDGNSILTIRDLSNFSAKRRVDAREANPDFTLDFSHRLFGSSNASTLLTIFGGRVKDLETILLEERLPEGWESRVRRRFGLTLAQINLSEVIWVEIGINEKKYIREKAAAQAKVAVAQEEDITIHNADASTD